MMMPLKNMTLGQLQFLYDATRKWFFAVCCVVLPAEMVIDAPFGRFTAKSFKWLTLDGKLTWVLMELPAPISFLYTFLLKPLSSGSGSYSAPQLILAGCYLIHYANRALISPIRAPSRSRSHVIVLVMALAFNFPNGFLLGSYLSSPAAAAYLSRPNALYSPRFWVGVGLWTAGLIGNIAHDEILANIRRKANSKGKGKEGDKKPAGEHYAIPHGLLFKYVSFPNYFCEWMEWFGFAFAAAPFPVTSFSQLSLSWLLSRKEIIQFITAPPSTFFPSLTPPYIFFWNEIMVMFPRAYKSQLWYKEKFGDSFPKDRKIVVPFVL